MAVLGAGYIAVEMAGIFHGLGSETHLFFRGQTVLRRMAKSAPSLAAAAHTNAATHRSSSCMPPRLLGATLSPRGEESPRRLGAEERLRWRFGPRPRSPIPLAF